MLCITWKVKVEMAVARTTLRAGDEVVRSVPVSTSLGSASKPDAVFPVTDSN